MSVIIGIDLGTTNSAMSWIEAGQAVVIANAEGSRTTPSVVGFSPKGETLVGAIAQRQAVSNPKRTFASVKRHMGTNWTTDNVDGKKYTPQEIGARVLMKLKKDAEEYLGQEVTGAVITVPAYFSDAERQATKVAGEIAGLEVKHVINEPTAAALAYGLDKESDQIVLVYDLGGGTYDVSLLEIGDGYIEVMASAGDSNLGGDDWDNALVDYVNQKIQEEFNVDVSQDIAAMTRVKEAAEKAKKELSSSEETNINLPYLAMSPDNTPINVELDLTRAQFEDLTHDLLMRTKSPVEQVLNDAGIEKDKINQVLLVGGSTRMPAVTNFVKETFGKEPSKTVNPDEVVAMGAALQGGIASGSVKAMVLIDVTSLSLGVEGKGGVMIPLIPRGTAMPCRHSETFTTADDGQDSVHVQVFQGEREMTSGNRLLGQFDLTGIPPAPRGVPQIEVTFDINVNGILTVSARDKASGTTQQVSVSGTSGLSQDEINKAIDDAQGHAAEDQKRKEEVSNKNRAETLILQNERLLKDQSAKADSTQGKDLKEAVDKLKNLVASGSGDEIKSASDDVFSKAQAFGATLYSSPTPPPSAPTSTPATTAPSTPAEAAAAAADKVKPENNHDSSESKPA